LIRRDAITNDDQPQSAVGIDSNANLMSIGNVVKVEGVEFVLNASTALSGPFYWVKLSMNNRR